MGGALPTDEAVRAGTSSPPDQGIFRGVRIGLKAVNGGGTKLPVGIPLNERRESNPATTIGNRPHCGGHPRSLNERRESIPATTLGLDARTRLAT